MTIFSLKNINPPAAKKHVGRPTRVYTSDQVRDIITKHHNFLEMIDFSKKYDQLFEIHCQSSMSAISRLPTKTWRCFTQKKKKYAYIFPLVEIIVKQQEHLILINQQLEEWLMLVYY